MDEAQAYRDRSDDRSPVAFLREAVAQLFTRELLVPAVLLAILLTASNIVIVMNKPVPGQLPVGFVAAALVRVIGLVVLEVGILRILTSSPRPRWKPDGGFWLFLLLALVTVALAALVGRFVPDRATPAGMLISNLITTAILAPFAAWVVATGVARPLAWRPRPYMRDFSAWLPQLLLWSLLLVTPIAVLHGSLDAWMIRGAGDWFWPVALLDGPLSVVVALLGFSLNAAAYRRVARS
jgi:hypothetical protein